MLASKYHSSSRGYLVLLFCCRVDIKLLPVEFQSRLGTEINLRRLRRLEHLFAQEGETTWMLQALCEPIQSSGR